MLQGAWLHLPKLGMLLESPSHALFSASRLLMEGRNPALGLGLASRARSQWLHPLLNLQAGGGGDGKAAAGLGSTPPALGAGLESPSHTPFSASRWA